MHEGSKKAIVAALVANSGIAVAKFVGFAVTRSAGLLAEAIHSVADTGNQALLLLGSSRAKRRATERHQFGYGRERYFWAFIVAVVLFTLGGAFALLEGIEKLQHPHEIESLEWAIGILLFAIVLEIFSFRTAIKEANRVRGRHSLVAFVRRTKQPELPVVLLEDFGALMGLVFALGGVVTAEATDNPRWDAVGSISIGVLLCVIAVLLAWEIKGLLIGEAADEEVQAGIEAAIVSTPHVKHLIHLRTEHLGPEELLVGVKLEYDSDLDVAGLARAIDDTETRMRAAAPHAKLVYIEPDIRRAAQ